MMFHNRQGVGVVMAVGITGSKHILLLFIVVCLLNVHKGTFRTQLCSLTFVAFLLQNHMKAAGMPTLTYPCFAVAAAAKHNVS